MVLALSRRRVMVPQLAVSRQGIHYQQSDNGKSAHRVCDSYDEYEEVDIRLLISQYVLGLLGVIINNLKTASSSSNSYPPWGPSCYLQPQPSTYSLKESECG
jgi:hypothetical protein